MKHTADELQQLRDENAQLRVILDELKTRLYEPEQLIRAIRRGEVDAFVVTEKDSEQVYSLRRADRLYRLMIEDMREGAVAVADGETIVYCNPYFAGLVGVGRDQLVSQSILSFVRPVDQPRFQELVQNAGNGDHRGEIGLIGAAGKSVPVSVATNRLIGLSETQDIRGVIVTDLTPYKRQEELILADQRKNEFLALLGHELRNPLAVIANGIEVLHSIDAHDEEAQRVHELVERQAKHMTHLIDDLLDVTRISSGKIMLRRRRIDLTELIRKAVEDERQILDESGCSLELRVPDDPIWVHVDPIRMSQLFGNLLHNACKFTDPGGQITITAGADREEAVVAVRDTGIGMSREILDRLFVPFAQADDTLGRSRGGLGLGLALTKAIAELHGGTVTAQSEGPGRGSEFTVKVPRSTKQAPAEDADLTESPPDAPTGLRVLVVEDSAPVAEMFAMMLRHLGHEVETVSRGEIALERMATSRPQVVFSDISMPGMNGYELAARIRRQPEFSDVVLVAMTGYGQPEDRRKALEAGFDHHLVKPANPDQLERLFGEIAKS